MFTFEKVSLLHTILRAIGRQHWIRFGIRNRIVRHFCNPEEVESTSFKADFFGYAYKGNLNSYIDWNVYFYGSYERQYLFFLHKLIEKIDKPVFLDIGANIGQHSVFMSGFCEKVYAFEPNPLVRQRLDEKISMNGIANVLVSPVGLGVEEAMLPYFPPAGCNHGTGSFVDGYSSNNSKNSIELKVVNGDRYFEELQISRVDLIKIDVEGYEKYVLMGLKKMLRRHRPMITIEYSESTQKSFSELEAFMELLPDNYNVYRIVTDKPLLGIFNTRQAQLESFKFDEPGGDLLLVPA